MFGVAHCNKLWNQSIEYSSFFLLFLQTNIYSVAEPPKANAPVFSPQRSKMATPETRKRPNILITGVPGTGKTTLAPKVASNLNFEYIDVPNEIKKHNLVGEYDENYKCHILDEDKLLDHLQAIPKAQSLFEYVLGANGFG